MPRSPITLLRRLPRTVRLLVAGTFINRLGSFIVPFLTLVLHREFRLSEGQSEPAEASWYRWKGFAPPMRSRPCLVLRREAREARASESARERSRA